MALKNYVVWAELIITLIEIMREKEVGGVLTEGDIKILAVKAEKAGIDISDFATLIPKLPKIKDLLGRLWNLFE